MEITLITFLLLQLLLSQPIRAQPNSAGLEPSSYDAESFTRPKEVIIIAVICTLLFVSFYFIYLCYCLDDHSADIGRWSNWSGWRVWNNISGRSFRHSKTSYGLDPAIVNTFPSFEYGTVKSTMVAKGVLECAVCLMEFNDKAILRTIPKCDHVFHAACVDHWLIRNATCPVCRLNLTYIIDILDHGSRSENESVVDIIEDNIDNNEGTRLSLSVQPTGPRLLGRLSRSLSTGHMAVKQWEKMERLKVKLPGEVCKEVMTETSRSGRFGNAKVDRRGKSDSWVRASIRKHVRVEVVMTTTPSEDNSSPGVDVVLVDRTQLPV